MDLWFILALIVAVGGGVIAPAFLKKPYKQSYRILFLGIGGFLFVMSCWTIVGVNKVGFLSSFGRPTDVQANGFHLKAPWEIKTEFDGTHQFVRFEGGGDPKNDIFPCVNVKLTNNATACVSGVAEWKMDVSTPEARARALQLYKDYRTFDRVRDNYMWQRVQTALAQAFADHNPLVPSQNKTIVQLNDAATQKLKDVVGDTATIYSVVLKVPDYDDKTDNAIGNLQAEIANTATALQKVQTAQNEADAAAKLQAALSSNPAYMTNKCLDVAAQAIAKGINVQPGLCMGDGNSSLLLEQK